MAIYVLFQNHEMVNVLMRAGVSEHNNASWTLKEALQDDMRRDYYHRHLQQVQQAIK